MSIVQGSRHRSRNVFGSASSASAGRSHAVVSSVRVARRSLPLVIDDQRGRCGEPSESETGGYTGCGEVGEPYERRWFEGELAESGKAGSAKSSEAGESALVHIPTGSGSAPATSHSRYSGRLNAHWPGEAGIEPVS